MGLSSILILAVILNLFVGIFVWSAQRKSWLNISFGLMSILISIWVFLNYLFELQPGVFLLKCIFALGPFIVTLSFVWAHYIAEKSASKAFKYSILFLFSCAILVAILIFSNGMIKEVITSTNVIFGKAYYLYSIYLGSLLIGLVVYLLLKFRKSSSEQKRKFLYVLIGIFTFVMAILLFSLVLPNLGYDNLSMLDSPSSIILISFTAYAILSKQLFDIRVVLTQMATGIVILALLILTILSESFNQGIINGTILILVTYGSYLLNKSVLNDIKQKEQLTQANEQLQEDKKRLMEIDRMKDEFLQMATHELNTPIAVIEGKSSMIMDEDMGGFTPDQKKFLRSITDNSTRLAHLAKDMLNVTRIDQKRLTLVKSEANLVEMASKIVADLQFKAKKKNDTLTFEKPSQFLPKLFIDQTKIAEVFNNLIINAIKFTENGTIMVKIEPKDGEVIVLVKDTGIGIDKESQAHLFEKFHQIGRFDHQEPVEQQGTGLGLYISKKLIELHQGRIWLESELDKGTTFYFSLPINHQKDKAQNG